MSIRIVMYCTNIYIIQYVINESLDIILHSNHLCAKYCHNLQNTTLNIINACFYCMKNSLLDSNTYMHLNIVYGGLVKFLH